METSHLRSRRPESTRRRITSPGIHLHFTSGSQTPDKSGYRTSRYQYLINLAAFENKVIQLEEVAALNRKQRKKESECYYEFTTVRRFYSLGGAQKEHDGFGLEG